MHDSVLTVCCAVTCHLLLPASDDDDAQLLSLALACATDRVVVKRSKRLAPLVPAGPNDSSAVDLRLRHAKPSFAVTGTTTRFDVYVVST